MVYPALTDLATFVLVIGIGLPTVFLLSKALKLHQQTVTVLHMKEKWLSILVFIMAFVGAFGILAFYDKIWVRTTLTADPLYVLRDAIMMGMILLPVMVALRYRRQTLGSIAVTRTDLKRNIAFGLLASLVLLLFIGVLSPFLGGGYAGFSASTGYFLMSFVIIGFGEEIVFRGYIQTRMTAIKGALAGIGLSAIFYAAYNFPLGYFCFSGDIPLAAVYAGWRLSTGLLYAYAFHRSQNIVAPTLVHAFLGWGGLLFALYL